MTAPPPCAAAAGVGFLSSVRGASPATPLLPVAAAAAGFAGMGTTVVGPLLSPSPLTALALPTLPG